MKPWKRELEDLVETIIFTFLAAGFGFLGFVVHVLMTRALGLGG